jgi:hypothetical protein
MYYPFIIQVGSRIEYDYQEILMYRENCPCDTITAFGEL